MNQEMITPEEFLTFYSRIEADYLEGMEKLHRFRTERLLTAFSKDSDLMAEDLEVISDSLIGEIYELSITTEIVFIKNYARFKQSAKELIDQFDQSRVVYSMEPKEENEFLA